MGKYGMTLGTQTGSLMNHLYSSQDKASVEENVKVGDGCTILCWTDRHAATVIGIEGNKRKVIVIQEDTETLVDGSWSSEHQVYEYDPDPRGMIHRVSYRKGAWRIRGEERAVAFGARRAYRDPGF